MQDKWGREKSESYECATEFAHLDGNDALVMVKVHVVGGGRGRYGDRLQQRAARRVEAAVNGTVGGGSKGDTHVAVGCGQGGGSLQMDLRDGNRAREAENVEQTGVGINLAIAIIVVRIVELGVGLPGGAGNDVHDALAGERRVGLQP